MQKGQVTNFPAKILPVIGSPYDNPAPGKTAVLLLAHGTPNKLDEIPAYLSNVTGGRPIPDSVIEEISHRYSLIGPGDGSSLSPLTALTLEQGRLLEQRIGVPVYVGMRNWSPYISDVVEQMIANGVTSAVAICLAPQNSRTSVGLYRSVVMAAARDKMTIEFVSGWADHPMLADAFADRFHDLLWALTIPGCSNFPDYPVIFTAHSVPCRTVFTHPGQGPDPYSVEAKVTAALVAQRLRIKEWYFAFQSQGVSGGPWIGPTVEDTIAAIQQCRGGLILLQPIGFLCDHVEILYDIDISFRETAASFGYDLLRPESLNGSPLLTSALADLAIKGLNRLHAAAPAPAAQ